MLAVWVKRPLQVIWGVYVCYIKPDVEKNNKELEMETTMTRILERQKEKLQMKAEIIEIDSKV